MVTGHFVLLLLAVEGATIAQLKHLKTPKHDATSIGSYESLHDSQVPGLFMRNENQSDNQLTAVINTTDVDNTTTCSTWFYPKTLSNGSTVCECGSSLGRLIKCYGTSHVVGLLHCYCMTYNTDNSTLVVGASSYGCFHLPSDIKNVLPHYAIPLNPSDLNQHCEIYNRDGQLCGQCRKGFAPPVYSYGLHCTNCTNYANNWTKYVVMAFLPLTIFFVIVIIFRIRATSGRLNMLILVGQTISAPVILRTFTEDPYSDALPIKILVSFYGIWNLDFFRLLYSPFCLHPEMTTVQALALDYAIAVYPLVLIALTYLLVELHDNGFRVIVWLWKPFHRCSVCFRRGWNIKASLIDAFATFLLLSYVKFLSVSFDLLVPTRVYNIHGESLTRLYLFYDGSLEYFGKDHLPYGVLALVVIVVFGIFPLLLLCLYPCRCFQRCLNCCRLRSQLLHTFMDAFQGHYKDGTNGTRDCRWFSALYLIVRLVFLIAFSTVNNAEFYLPIGLSILLVLLLLTAIFHPYKSPIDNNIDIFLLVVFAFHFVALMAQEEAFTGAQITVNSSITGLIVITPLVYWVGILLYKLCSSIRCVRATCGRIWVSIPCHGHEEEPGVEEVFPYRMVSTEEYAPLIGEAVQDYNSCSTVIERSNDPDSETY